MIIDITQELFSCKVFPGDPQPQSQRMLSIDNGDICNLTSFSMCAHNGTHIDAPFHFLNNGKTVDQLDLNGFVGDCYVAEHSGNVTAEDAEKIMAEAIKLNAAERILIAGNATMTAEAARVFASHGILLIGNESQTFGPEDSPQEVHEILLGAEIILLEGIVLKNVKAGKYFLSAAPLNLGGCEGSPCRAYLICK